MKKSISIIIPVYNEAKYLPACLQAIADQTIKPDEVLVVDNNSTDDSVAIAQSFPFVTLVNAPKQGIVEARNIGFDAAKSDIIARIDADTTMPTNWISRVHQFYDGGNNDTKALTGGGYFYNVRWPRFNGWIQSQLAYRLNRLIIGHYVLWGSNMAFPRQLWLNVRNSTCERQDIHEDLDLSFHLHNLGVAITYHGRLRVGVCLKRVYSERKYVHMHMKRWPQTLRVHGYYYWWLATIGNWFLWYIMQPLLFFLEYGAQLFGKKPLNK